MLPKIPDKGLHCLAVFQQFFDITKVVTWTSDFIGQVWLEVKGSIFLKNRHFMIQERFNKLIFGINTIIKCGTLQPEKFQVVCCSWNEMIFYPISELMLATLIQRYDKKSFHFWFSSKRETNWNLTGFQVPHFMIVLIPYIYLNLCWMKNVYFWGIWSLRISKFLGWIL